MKSADILSQNLDYRDERLAVLEDIKKIAKDILENEEALKLSDLKIDGKDVMEYGYRGSEIGNVLNEILEIVIENPEKNKKDYLLEYLKNREK